MKRGKKDLSLGLLSVIDFQGIDGEDAWIGTVYLFGTPHHFTAVKVRHTDDGLEATNDPEGRLEEVWSMVDAIPMTTEIPGLPGEYVVWIQPHGD